ncbi:MAG: hypothetical protein II234_00070 [Clostridia bacterium]|nr:hypothetical protein [Clostridia bacterium]
MQAEWTYRAREKWEEIRRKEINGGTLTEEENNFSNEMYKFEDYAQEVD